MIKKLSPTAIADLKPKASPYDTFDREVSGLTVRTQPSGHKSFCVFYRVRGSSTLKRRTLGSVSIWSLDKARATAREILIAANMGTDAANVDPNAAGTFGALADAYLKGWAYFQGRKRTASDDERQLSTHRVEPWNVRAASSITSADARLLFDEVAKTAPVAANRLRALLHKVFQFGLKRGLVAANPITGTEKPAPEQRRKRKLSENEVRSLWLALNEEKPHVAAVFRLLLLTGCRKNEVARLKQTEIEGSHWVLPAERSKNKRALLVSLTPYMLELTAQIGKGFNLQTAFSRIRKRAELSDVVIHDTRRAFGSYMGKLRVDPHVIARLLNHSPTTVTDQHYNLYEYQDQKAEALLRWERYLLNDVVSGGKVVALPVRALK